MRIITPTQLPLRFYGFEQEPIHKFRSRLLKDYAHVHTVLDYQNSPVWRQPWQIDDTVVVQIMSDTPGLSLKLIRCDKSQVTSVVFEQRVTNWTVIGTAVYEVSLTFMTEGIYYLAICQNDDILLISDPQQVYEELPNSLLLRYYNRRNKGHVAFDTGLQFQMRIPGVITDPQPSSDSVIYTNQKYDKTLLHSDEWLIWKLIIGDQFGIPDYMIQILNTVFGLSNIYIDETRYVKADESAKFEKTMDKYYAMAGYSLQIVESENRTSFEFGTSSGNTNNLLFNSGEFVLYTDGAENKILSVP